ncbi:MAG: hypothetical protein AUG44_19090 [Actinobacteria bacterium 13_1_20CM_3_71_11]|nr:MAG: hypothetical protein AUG44_19090 [Actinobacteria bacterium 13_1_20CM_3_71_11]
MSTTDENWDRVVVVSLGAVTAQGPTAEDLWQGARAGRVAIGTIQHLDTDGLQTKLAGEVYEYEPPRPDYPCPDGFRERALDFALLAAREALAALPARSVPAERFGVVLGTCNAGLLSGREWLRQRAAGLPGDGRLAGLVTPQALAEWVAGAFGLSGPVLAVNTACASGANALGLAADLLRLGRADAVLAGGTDALSDVVLAGFNSLESLSPSPAAPYSGNRQGLSLGEGAGMLALMRYATAQRYGLPVVAEVLGYSLSADGYHATAPRPDGSGAAGAIRAALAHAGVRPEQVGYVNGHGTGTPKNDVAETRAIRLAYGPAADRLLVSSTKSVIGHLLGAAGAAEAIVTMRSLQERTAPPTAGYREPDPECDLDYVPDGARPYPADVAVSNNFAFAGANAAVVLSRPAAVPVPPRPAFDTVVVTGLAVLSPAGDGPAAAWSAWQDGTGGDPPVRRLDLDPEPYLNRRERRRMDRLSVVSVVAAAKALADAGIDARSERAAGCGVIFGTGVGPMEAMERFTVPLLTEGPSAADPGVFPNTVYNQAAGQVAMHLGLYGPTSTLSVGHASGSAILAYAADLLALRHSDALLCVASDVLTPEVEAAYAASIGRRGWCLAEGSVALVLERAGAARARGARILGSVLGYGMSSAAGGRLPWDRTGAAYERAMRTALSAAGTAAADITEVWLSATGRRGPDRAEARAVERVFGPDGPRRLAPKVVLGEPMGVGGALSVALALHGPARSGAALVNSSSFGGSEVSLVIGPVS